VPPATVHARAAVRNGARIGRDTHPADGELRTSNT
jgi:hypothetical protein